MKIGYLEDKAMNKLLYNGYSFTFFSSNDENAVAPVLLHPLSLKPLVALQMSYD